MKLVSFICWVVVLILETIVAAGGEAPTWTMVFIPLVTLVIVTGFDAWKERTIRKYLRDRNK